MKIARTLISLSTAAVMVAVLAASPAAARGRGNSQLVQVRAELERIRAKIARSQGQEKELAGQVKALSTQIEALGGSIQQQQQRLAVIASDIRSAESDVNRLRQEFAKRKELLGSRAARLYKDGANSTLSQLLEARSIGQFVRALQWTQVAADIDGRILVSASRSAGNLEERRQELILLKEQRSAQRIGLSGRRNILEQAQAQREAALIKVRREMVADQAHIKDLERASENLTARLQAQQRAAKPAESGRAEDNAGGSEKGFAWPKRGSVTSPFGRRRGGFHPGIDIDGNTGDPIYASKSGSVMGTSCGSGYGICVLIDHGEGQVTLYAHMSRKAASGHVSRGQLIGYVGCTGSCTGSHLHFEVRINGSPQNPMKYL